MKPSVNCEIFLDVRRIEDDRVAIEFDNVIVIVSMGLLGVLYAAIYAVEAEEND